MISRLGEELARAASEISRDPRGFVRDLFSGDTKDTKRRRRIYSGLAVAVLAHGAALAGIAYLGWHSAFVKDNAPEDLSVRIIDFTSKAPNAPEAARPDKPAGENGGGGGGGQPNVAPATKGVAPQMLPIKPIIKPLAPSHPNPVLPVMPSVVGPESAPVPSSAAIGVPTGVAGVAPSPGDGTGPGIGGGNGGGAGPGSGPGAGPGSGGGPGNKRAAGDPNGNPDIPSEINWNGRKPAGYVPFSWKTKMRAIVTPEADANKVIGTFVCRATIEKDGEIRDIEVVSPVPYMTESAIESLKRSRMNPATVNGVPITVRNVILRVDVHY